MMEDFNDNEDDDEYGGDGDEWSWLGTIRILMMLVMLIKDDGGFLALTLNIDYDNIVL